jgi:membrane protein DedA with SNARE-associated domain
MTTDHLSLPLVLILAVLGAYLGDIITFAVPRFGSEALLRFVERRQQADRLAKGRDQFARRGWQLVVIGRLVPAGRIPVLLAAGTLGYPWRKFLPSGLLACVLWATAYAVLGIVSGGIFDSPLVATLLATVLVLLVTVLTTAISKWRATHRRAAQQTGGNR